MRLTTLLLGIVFLTGCQIIDPAEEIPSYISIPSVSFTNPGGSGSHKITDAWIYVDGKLIGGFEIPCKVPVMAEGTCHILVLPGIKQNGMSTLRAIYPFYKEWEATAGLTRGQVTVLEPEFAYFPSVQPSWDCDFDEPGVNFDGDVHAVFPGMLTLVSGTEALEGRSARVDLSAAENIFYGTSTDSFVFDQSREIYLECDYRSDQPFIIGLRNCDLQQDNNIDWLLVQPSAEWNKIYVRLNDALAGFPPGTHYSISVRSTLAGNQNSGTIWLDNLKLLY